MKNIFSKKILPVYFIIIALLGTGCDDFFQDLPPQNIFEEEVFNDIARNRDFLNGGYDGVRNREWIELDYHTDNAVSLGGSMRSAVTGGTAESSPVAGEWARAMGRIIHINQFIRQGFSGIIFDIDSSQNAVISKRSKGEAFGLRAYYKWLLLKNFAGPAPGGTTEFLGFPIIDSISSPDKVNEVPRSTYMESFNSIIADIDTADKYIDVLRYAGTSALTGVSLSGRVSGEMLEALRSRLYLFAASPAYNQVSWETAAEVIHKSIEIIEGSAAVVNLQNYGRFDNSDNPDDFWRSTIFESADLEQRHFPPSLYGLGQCNPSQNLIDAFPDVDGFPITDPRGSYLASEPFSSRDARLDNFIFTTGPNIFGLNTPELKIYKGGEDADGGIRKQATRTGYYMKKYLNPTVNITPQENRVVNVTKFGIVFNRAALYLDFAEASSEAFGPTGTGPNTTLTAVQVLTEIRERAGFLGDDYLNNDAAGDLFLFRELVQNERRIELCFTGERFYDVRRWKLPLEEMTKPVMGVEIERNEAGTSIYTPKEVESRSFDDSYMYYNPIPRAEIFRSKALVQNNGW